MTTTGEKITSSCTDFKNTCIARVQIKIAKTKGKVKIMIFIIVTVAIDCNDFMSSHNTYNSTQKAHLKQVMFIWLFKD